MEPKTTTHPDETTPSPETHLTAGQLARRLDRSSYGVKKAIKRLGIHPKLVLGGISYYDTGIEKTLAQVMRAPNLQPLQS